MKYVKKINKVTSGGSSSGAGGAGDFASLTGSPYDNTNLGNALDSKQNRINGIVSGCDISVGSYGGSGSNNDVKVTSGTWYITPSEYTKGTDTLLLDIALCSAGLLKYVDVIGDNTNTITIVDGAESTSPQHYVINPATEVLLGYILISDSVIEAPTPILTSLTKKFEDMGSRIGSFTLDCETKDFPSFKVRLDGVTWGTFTLNFSNFLNVVEGIIYLDIISTSTLNLPATSYESGSVITSKTFSVGTYRVTFGYLYSEYFFDFALVSGGGTWGSITGTLSAQTDLQSALDNKVSKNTPITGATKTKVTYDSKGLVTNGVDATTADISDSTNKRYVTDANLTTIGSQSGTNTGDETTSSIQTKRPLKTINSQSLEGAGDLTVTGFTAASVAEINTGTENSKGATPLGLEGSKYITQNGSKIYATTGGTSTAYTVTLSPAITAYVAGQQFNISVHTSNTTTTPTINFNGLGAKNILNKYGTAIAVNDFKGDVTVRYNGTAFLIVTGVATNEVGNDKLAQMAANTIKANNTGSTANASDVTTDQFTAMMEIATSIGTTGIITALTSATFKYIRLTSASATGLGSIVAPTSSYKDLYIWNDTGVTLTLYNEYLSEATAANRINCLASLTWANNTICHFKYDVVESRWVLVVMGNNMYFPLRIAAEERIASFDVQGVLQNNYKIASNFHFAQRATNSAATNTTSETAIITATEGSKTIVTSDVYVGKRIRLESPLLYSTTGTPTLTLQVRFGPSATALTSRTSLVTSGAITMPSSVTELVARVEAVTNFDVIGTSGVAQLTTNLFITYDNGSTGSIVFKESVITTGVDTTVDNVYELTATWSAASASNTIITKIPVLLKVK